MNVPYHVIIEEDQYNKYAEYIDKSKLLILPKKYQDEYDVFWDDDDPRVGPGAARNFAWDHSIENGHEWHWVMDDNIDKFDRYNNNLKIQCNNGSVFYIAEEFVLRYTNVAQAGLNYAIFCPAGDGRPPVKFNTRIYSCLLIRNDVPYRWRGRYNEDTDLSLRMLKDGWCTIQFNAFLAEKRATQTVKGGNSAEFYDDEGTKNKSQMLVDMHPDVTTLTKRWNRWHHMVNYKPFENNKPILINSDDETQSKITNSQSILFGKKINSQFVFKEFSKDFISVGYNEYKIKSKLIGSYNFYNIIAAISFGLYFKIDIKSIINAIENYTPKNNRSEILHIKDKKIILDAYNANPTSMKLAIDSFFKLSGSKALILADMLELGVYSKDEHQEIINHLEKENTGKTYLVGEEFYKLKSESNSISFYKTKNELILEISNNKILEKNILIKGSRAMKMEELINLI